MASRPIDFALATGDYAENRVNENGQDYTELNNIARQYPGNWYTAVGNHDVNGPSTDHADEVPEFFNQADVFTTNEEIRTLGYGLISLPNNVELIILNNQENLARGPNPASGLFAITEQQMTRLSDYLESISSNSKVIVLIHAPLKTDAIRANSPVLENIHDQTQADEIINLLIDWQAANDGGLVLGVIAGHTHIDGTFESTTPNGTINSFTLDEFDDVPSGYPGSADVISTDPRWMSYAHFSFDTVTNVLTVTGVGEQASHVVDMSDRV